MAKIESFYTTTRKGLPAKVETPQDHDAQELLDVSREMVRHSPYFLTDISEFAYTLEQEKMILDSHLSHPHELAIQARVDGRIAGVLTFRNGFRKKVSHHGEIGMGVAPGFFRQGIGQLLLDVFLDWAKADSQIEQIRLQVFESNTPAVQLYLNSGFEIEGRQIKGIKFNDGTYDDVLCMVKMIK